MLNWKVLGRKMSYLTLRTVLDISQGTVILIGLISTFTDVDILLNKLINYFFQPVTFGASLL